MAATAAAPGAGSGVEFAADHDPATMDVTPILSPLNDAQRAAVTAPLAPTLVLAGAGSGKTRVLIHRIAWLIQAEGASPHGILAVTFTNKAAAEMRARVEELLGSTGAALWLGTFHGLAHRLLRLHWREAGLPRELPDPRQRGPAAPDPQGHQGARARRGALRAARGAVLHQQAQGRGAAHRAAAGRRRSDRAHAAARLPEYQQACARAGAVDFAELLLRAFALWRDNPELLRHYRSRFRHVLVDEFQDTNAIQYAWVRLLVGTTGCPFVVGDDDQSIYRWRGARDREPAEVPPATFRRRSSTSSSRTTARARAILEAANALIANNSTRLGKELWTSGERGEPVRVYCAYNERDEADVRDRRASSNGSPAAACGANARSCTARTRNRACSRKR